MQNKEKQMAHNGFNGLTPTAVEWLVEQIRYYISNDDRLFYMFKKAKEMEKQQIIDACKRGYKRNSFTPNFREQQELFEQYYNETFKKK